MPKGSEFTPITATMLTDEIVLIRGNTNVLATLLQLFSDLQLANPHLTGSVQISESTPGAADQALIIAGTNVMDEMGLHAKKSNPVFEIAITTPILKIGTAEASVEVTVGAEHLNNTITAPGPEFNGKLIAYRGGTGWEELEVL